MTRRCTVCEHAEREAIEKALLAGQSYRQIAQRFALSPYAVYRHRAKHLPAALAQAQAAQEVARGNDLLAQIQNLQARTLRILSDAEESGERRTALQAIAEARRNLELLAKLLGELQEGTTVNVLLSPQWVELRTLIIAALAGYPEAKVAVVEALKRVSV